MYVVYVSMYVCVCLPASMTSVLLSVCVFPCICVYRYMCVFACMSACVCECVCVRVCGGRERQLNGCECELTETVLPVCTDSIQV